jgi:preprotein translocase subunit SecE
MNRELRRQQARQERLEKKKGTTGRQAAAQRAATRATRAPEEQKERRGVRTYLHEVRQELSKVSWPDRPTLLTYTAVSLIATVALTLYTAGSDFIFRQFFIEFLLS